MENDTTLMKNLCSSILPAAFLEPRRHFLVKEKPTKMNEDHLVKGKSTKRNEDYLIELVNSIPYFLEKSEGEYYNRPQSESHGECDCVSAKYALDFKVICSKRLLQAKNIFSPGLYIDKEKGVKIETGAKIVSPDDLPEGSAKREEMRKRYKPIEAMIPHKAFRSFSLEKLKQDEDTRGMIEKFEVNKNAFFFYPFVFYLKKVEIEPDAGISHTCRLLSEDFLKLFQERSSIHPKLDSYFCFLYSSWNEQVHDYMDDCFVVSKIVDNRLQTIDVKPISVSPIFQTIAEEVGISHGPMKIRIYSIESGRPPEKIYI